MVALTTMGIIIDNPITESIIKDNESYICEGDISDSIQYLPYFNEAPISDIQTVDLNIENVFPKPPAAVLRTGLTTTTIINIRDILEETFWA